MKTQNFSYTWIRKINEQKLQYISSNKLKYILKLLIPLLAIISLIILIFWALEISKNSVTQMGFGKGTFKEDVMIGPNIHKLKETGFVLKNDYNETIEQILKIYNQN